ncbi:MAG: MerR family transcriptional regulator [Clostridia bacterium]|nr:MerR family transcriptional regulator [Clostridia bacterium]
MKIKQVCELTGLTDRAIRYYIEEGLVSPAYTENYMGRRAYDFAENDVAALNHVATLRKFGFTVEEIRRILADPQESVAIVAEVRARKEETVRQEGENLDALARLEAEKAYTVAELAEALVEPVREVEVPKEDRHITWREAAQGFLRNGAVWIIALIPLLLVLTLNLSIPYFFRYPRFATCELKEYLILMVLSLVPTLVLLPAWFLWFRRGKLRGLKWALVILCALYLPVSVLLQISSHITNPYYSITEDVRHYLKVDRGCDARYEELVYGLFPAQPHTTAYVLGEKGFEEQSTQPRYFYRYACRLEPSYEVFAEWTLTPDELAAERQRVEALLTRAHAQEGQGVLETIEQGDYTCIAFWIGERPFEHLYDSYATMAMFAWNEETGRVRYMFNYYTYPANESWDPESSYYMTLDWGEEAAQ